MSLFQVTKNVLLIPFSNISNVLIRVNIKHVIGDNYIDDIAGIAAKILNSIAVCMYVCSTTNHH